jgi:ribosomal protein S18 acetylase RimI-like enzyme
MCPDLRSITPILSFRKARADEAGLIAGLVNAAYRGASSRAGWTTEADLLGGQRTDEGEIRRLLGEERSLILLCLNDSEVIGSVVLQQKGDAAYLGMLVVRPVLQGGGIGKQLIRAAETLAQREWGSRKITMTVITRRPELLAFYERRGYRRTGQVLPFPDDPAAGIPLVPELEFELLEKEF